MSQIVKRPAGRSLNNVRVKVSVVTPQVKERTTNCKTRATPERLEYVGALLKNSIEKANLMCNSQYVQDVECMVQWDEVAELTSAYRHTKEKLQYAQKKIDILSGFDEGDDPSFTMSL